MWAVCVLAQPTHASSAKHDNNVCIVDCRKTGTEATHTQKQSCCVLLLYTLCDVSVAAGGSNM